MMQNIDSIVKNNTRNALKNKNSLKTLMIETILHINKEVIKVDLTTLDIQVIENRIV